MKYEEPVVFNLLDDKQRAQAHDHVKREITIVDEQIAQTEREQKLLQEVDAALSRIQDKLVQMRRIADIAATEKDVDRDALAAEFENLKREIDHIAADVCAQWSAAESAQLRKMVAELSTDEIKSIS